MLEVNRNFLDRYVRAAPLALGIERWHECEILAQQDFVRPVLDLGCGDGVFASVLFRDPIDVGIDPNPRELERARQLGAYQTLLECRGDAIPRPDGAFLTIFSNSVLEHIRDLEPVLREAHRLLAPGGRFYATVPSNLFDHYSILFQLLSGLGLEGSAERFRQIFNRFWRHYHFYSPDGWRALFQRAGFDVVGFQEYCPKPICMLNDALAPLGGPSMVVKTFSGRWFLSEQIRALYAPILVAAIRPLLALDPDLVGGGILFFALAHRAEPQREK